MKIQIDCNQLIQLGELAIKNNKTIEFIHLVFDWVKAADEEIKRLKKLTEE